MLSIGRDSFNAKRNGAGIWSTFHFAFVQIFMCFIISLDVFQINFFYDQNNYMCFCDIALLQRGSDEYNDTRSSFYLDASYYSKVYVLLVPEK